jgi:hypothetical protein
VRENRALACMFLPEDVIEGMHTEARTFCSACMLRERLLALPLVMLVAPPSSLDLCWAALQVSCQGAWCCLVITLWVPTGKHTHA